MAQAKKRTLKEKKAPELPVLNPTAAGIDIGATEIYVAVHKEAKLKAVRKATEYAFPTADIEQMLAEIERGYEK